MFTCIHLCVHIFICVYLYSFKINVDNIFSFVNINLVDPASSHTLVSKIKPCMSKYKQLYSETANGSLYQL